MFQRILQSSPKAVAPARYAETVQAWNDALSQGYAADTIERAWEVYLDATLEKNAEQGSQAITRWAMFPSNFLTRANGLRFWARRLENEEKTTVGSTPASDGAAVGPAPANPGAKAEAIAKKHRLRLMHTTTGPVWTFTDQFNSLTSCSGKFSRREAIVAVCKSNDLPVPDDIDDISDEKGQSNAA